MLCYGRVLLICCFLWSFGISAYGFDEHSGWWFIEGREGTGLSLEVQGNTLFVALYSYDFFGNPVWFTSALYGKHGSFSGILKKWEGWPLDGEYIPPLSADVGVFRVEFDSEDHELAVVTYNPNAEMVHVQVAKFLCTLSPGSLDPRDISGWWYDPSNEGMGWFVEARGGVMAFAWYHYDETGRRPDWHSCYGEFPQGSMEFSCSLKHWSGGSPLGLEPYVAPKATDVGEASLVFNKDGKADFYWNGKHFHLERFIFGNPSDRG